MIDSTLLLLLTLTQAGDSFAGLVTVVAVYFSVGVVQDGPAVIVLHSIIVALVVDLTAPTTNT